MTKIFNFKKDPNKKQVNIANIITEKKPHILTAVLGSCIGIALYEPKMKIGSLAHAMLPTIKESSGMRHQPKKYVDSAIEYQINSLKRYRVKKERLLAKITGGANMFRYKNAYKKSLFSIGQRNIEITEKILWDLGISIVSRDIGFDFGRSIEFDLSTGAIKIFKAGGKYRKTI